MINLLLIEEHKIVREGLALLFSQSSDTITLLGSTSSSKEGLEIANKQAPHVILLDFQLSDFNGLELTRKLLRVSPSVNILVMSRTASSTLALQSLDYGAKGFITKYCDYSELVQAIHKVHKGEKYLSKEVTSMLAIQSIEPDKKIYFDILSSREMEIALSIVDGKSPDEIAKRLNVTTKTIHSYRYRIFEKLAIKSDLELLRLALKLEIIKLDNDV